MVDLNRADRVTDDVKEEVKNQFFYKPWNPDQQIRGDIVRSVLIEASLAIISVVPPCPDRTVALRKLREARMDCNSAISHDGKY